MKISYLSKKNVDQLIATAISSSNTMRKNVQIAAVHVLIHAAQHGDYSKAQILVDGLGDGVNARGLVQWFVEFGGLTVSEGADGFDGWQGKAHIAQFLDQAKAKMWWEFKVQNPYQGFNIVEAVTKTIAAAEKALAKKNKALSEGDNETAEKIKVTQDKINDLQKFLKVA
jgi:hypothetical protein